MVVLPRLLDRQGWSILLAGALLLLISSTTNDGDDNLVHFRGLQEAHEIGVGLHLATLAAINWRPFATSSSERSRRPAKL